MTVLLVRARQPGFYIKVKSIWLTSNHGHSHTVRQNSDERLVW
jgi:hypothetical protein